MRQQSSCLQDWKGLSSSETSLFQNESFSSGATQYAAQLHSLTNVIASTTLNEVKTET